MVKPSWKYAPEWAGWLAADYYGDWYWHATEPFRGECEWHSEKYKHAGMAARNGNAYGDWYRSDAWDLPKESRP